MQAIVQCWCKLRINDVPNTVFFLIILTALWTFFTLQLHRRGGGMKCIALGYHGLVPFSNVCPWLITSTSNPCFCYNVILWIEPSITLLYGVKMVCVFWPPPTVKISIIKLIWVWDNRSCNHNFGARRINKWSALCKCHRKLELNTVLSTVLHDK